MCFIESIEEFGAKLQTLPFCDRERLESRKVEIDNARPDERIKAGIAQGSFVVKLWALACINTLAVGSILTESISLSLPSNFSR